MKIYYLFLPDSVSYTDISYKETLISEKRKQRILQSANEKVKREALVTALLVRYATALETGVLPHCLAFFYNEHGKPYIEGFTNTFLSVSQKRNLFAVAFDCQEIGLDVEKIVAAKAAVARRVFSEKEKKYLKEAVDTDRAFFEIWTRKEAYVKYLGTGLSSVPLIDTDTLHLEEEASCSFHTDELKGYLLTVCRKDSIAQAPELICVDMEQLLGL